MNILIYIGVLMMVVGSLLYLSMLLSPKYYVLVFLTLGMIIAEIYLKIAGDR